MENGKSREEKEKLLLDGVFYEGFNLSELDAINKACLEIQILKDSFGSYDEIKKTYEEKPQNEKLKFLESIGNKYLLVFNKHENTFSEFSNIIEKIKESGKRRNAEHPIYESLELQYNPKINYLVLTLEKIKNLYELENELQANTEPADSNNKNNIDEILLSIGWKSTPDKFREQIQYLKDDLKINPNDNLLKSPYTLQTDSDTEAFITILYLWHCKGYINIEKQGGRKIYKFEPYYRIFKNEKNELWNYDTLRDYWNKCLCDKWKNELFDIYNKILKL